MIVADFRELSNYSWFLNNYAIWIENGFNGLQKDYYKECTNVALWYGKIKGNRIQLIFFKNRNDYEHILQRDSCMENSDSLPVL